MLWRPICERTGCSSNTCYRYSYDYGYLCDTCFGELVSLGGDQDIEEFMRSKVHNMTALELSYIFFNNIFPDRS